MRKSKKDTKNKRNILAAAVILCCIILSIVLFAARSAKEVEARDYAPGREKLYTAITVEQGDTLWELADRHMSAEYHDKDTFIEEVREMNHITGSVIKAGDTLYIPYYAEPVTTASVY